MGAWGDGGTLQRNGSRRAVWLLGAVLLSACGGGGERSPEPAAEIEPADQFLNNLRRICGQAFSGRVVRDEGADMPFPDAALVMHVADCGEEVRIPFHVGEDRSRTWVFTRTDEGLRLKHDHRHDDGTPDVITQYGGETSSPREGSAQRQEFPADRESVELFRREDLAVSVDNVWAVEIDPDTRFAYELTRPGRDLRIEFDLTQPVDPPPPAWGAD